MNLYPYLRRLLPYLAESQHNKSVHNSVYRLWVSLQSAHKMPHYSDSRQWNCESVCQLESEECLLGACVLCQRAHCLQHSLVFKGNKYRILHYNAAAIRCTVAKFAKCYTKFQCFTLHFSNSIVDKPQHMHLTFDSMQGVPRGMDKTSGECSLCWTIPI